LDPVVEQQTDVSDTEKDSYSCTFGEGPLGLGFVRMPGGHFVVDKASGQSLSNDVKPGSRILAIDGVRCGDSSIGSNTLVQLIQEKHRPLDIQFSAPCPELQTAATKVRADDIDRAREVTQDSTAPVAEKPSKRAWMEDTSRSRKAPTRFVAEAANGKLDPVVERARVSKQPSSRQQRSPRDAGHLISPATEGSDGPAHDAKRKRAESETADCLPQQSRKEKKGASPCPMAQPLALPPALGSRVRVTFSDGQTYGGEVNKHTKNGRRIQIKYDDGDEEWACLPDPDIAVCQGADSGSGSGSGSAGSGAGSGSSRRNQKNCEHGRLRYYCIKCGGAGICKHGRARVSCKDCGGSAICKHGHQRYSCVPCGGKGICPHARQWRRCKDAQCKARKAPIRPKAMCEHNRPRYTCLQCGGAGICPHQRIRASCKDCNGASYCQHGRQRYTCVPCGGKGICPHARQLRSCKEAPCIAEVERRAKARAAARVW
jgi:hypothetical protein